MVNRNLIPLIGSILLSLLPPMSPVPGICQSLPGNPHPFQTGEKLTFNVKYGGVTAGIATMQVEGTKRLGTREVLHIKSKTETVNIFEKIYSVHDVIETFVDPGRLTPFLYRVKLRESNYSRDKIISFDPETNTAIYIKNVELPQTYEVDPLVQDPLSSLYFLRTQSLEVGKSVTIKLFDDRKLYDMEVQVLRQEQIRTPLGSFETVLVKPILQSEGIFKRTGEIFVWLSDDDWKVPLKMKSKIKIGDINAEISRVEGVPSFSKTAEN